MYVCAHAAPIADAAVYICGEINVRGEKEVALQRKVFRIAVPKPKACFVEVGEFYGQGVVIMEIRRVVRAFACSFVSLVDGQLALWR